MNSSTESPEKRLENPNGTGLLVLGILSCLFGPLTAVPGLIISKRFRPFSPTASAGYILCWLFLVLSVLMLVGVALRGRV
jgi:hypothetical protein